MEKKGKTRKAWGKIVFGILFVISCFIAMYVLIHFYDQVVLVGGAAALLFISAFLFLNALFSENEKFAALPEEEEAFLNGTEGEFHLKIANHMKEVEKNQKEMLQVLKNQSDMIQSKLEDVRHEVYLLSEKQVTQTKSIIKYNKENARQLAISERETLEYILQELKEKPALEAVAEDELLQVSNLVADEEYIEPEISLTESEPELVEEPVQEPAVEIGLEEAPVEESEPASAMDANAMMTPEEIAKLLASMGQ